MKGCAITAALMIAALISLPRIILARGMDAGPEKILFDSANRERAARGIPPLKWDAALARAARRHALEMARRNSLAHQFPGERDLPARAIQAGARFSAVAENVAEGPSAASIHAEWMKSPPHRRNLLDPELNSLGVAVAERRGVLFAVEDFSHALADLSLKEQERELGAQLRARGLLLLGNSEDVHKACEGGRISASHRPMFLVRYTTADLDELPGVLKQKIRSGRYHTAAVGACSPARQTAFGEYQLAVLLFE